jgi:membrane associated rhomboid family serine protease
LRRGEAHPVASLFFGTLAVAVYLSPAATAVLEYDRAAVAAGEIWRLLTGHLTHWSFDHLFWDVLGLAIPGLPPGARSSSLASPMARCRCRSRISPAPLPPP